MTQVLKREKAIKLRLKGYSYSQIKDELGISKGTLSGWLSEYPLSVERIKELRDKNPRRIENYINTMRRKREQKVLDALRRVSNDIGLISRRDLFLGGFFLYWAEGGKTKQNSLSLSNSDPSMIRVFILWLQLIGVPKEKIKVKLHLYKDMNVSTEINFWQKTLGVQKTQFAKPYIKNSSTYDLTYKNGFGHGTCNVVFDNTLMARYILMGVRYVATTLIEEKVTKLHL